MFVVHGDLIEEAIALERFACDLPNCKGACCTLPGGRGAPLEDAEVQEIQSALPSALKHLPPEHRRTIEEEGAVEGSPGSFATVCVRNRACVFVFYDGDVARCALEAAHLLGKTAWRKPLSCHLFPIRVSKGFGSGDRLRYEKIPECLPGRRMGEEHGKALHAFLKEPLVRAYGAEWYSDLVTECSRPAGGALQRQ